MEIKNYPNYLIYRDGKVFSKKSNKFLKESTLKYGYKFVGLNKYGKQKMFYIHRLLGIHFIPNPENKPTIDHINRNRSDNRIENLRWATHLEQCQNKKEQSMKKNNTSGHIGICFRKDSQMWIYQKRGKYKIRKCFKSKTDCLCFKFYWILKNNSRKYSKDPRDIKLD